MCRGLALNLVRENGKIEEKCSFKDDSHHKNTKNTGISNIGNDDQTLPLEIMVWNEKLVWDIDEQRRDKTCVEFQKEYGWLVKSAKTVSKRTLKADVRKFMANWMKENHFKVCEAIALHQNTRSSTKCDKQYNRDSKIKKQDNRGSKIKKQDNRDSKIKKQYNWVSKIEEQYNGYSKIEEQNNRDSKIKKQNNRDSKIKKQYNRDSKIEEQDNYRAEIRKMIISESQVKTLDIEVRSDDYFPKIIGKAKVVMK